MIQPDKENSKVLPEEEIGKVVSKKEAKAFTQSEATQQQEFGLDTTNTNRQDFWNSIGDSDFGSSKYDNQRLTLEDTNDTIQQHRYEEQDLWDKSANSIGRTASGIGLKLVDGIAFTGAMIDNGLQGKFDVSDASENAVSKKLRELEDTIDKALPIYKPTNYDQLGFYDKIMNTNGAFFFDEGAEAFEFVGATALSTYLGSGLINAGVRTARLAATSLGNINKVKKSADLLTKASKTFGAGQIGDALNKAKNLSVFGENQTQIYKAVSDATSSFVKNNVLTKETALNIYNTAVEAGMEGHEVAKQYLDSVEQEINARQSKEFNDRLTKIQGAVGVSDQEKQNLIQDLKLEQSKEKESLLVDASEEAKIRANNTFLLNAAALYGPNMIQTKALLGSIGSSREGIKKFGNNLAEIRNNIQKTKPSYFAELGKSYVKNYPSELGQEIIQKGISDYQLESHPDSGTGYLESGMNQVMGSIGKAIKSIPSQETAETALITALITAPTTFIDASHRTEAAKGEVKAMNVLLDNADKLYSNYSSDVKSVYKTDANGKIIIDEKTKQPIIDQDVIDRNVYGQISDFATALETSDAILNNDETRLNLVRGRALAKMSHDYASMGDNGKSLALMVIDDKAKEASDNGDQNESIYLQGQKKQIEGYIDLYNKIEKSEGNSADLFDASNDKDASESNREVLFHKKYKKSLYHQAATRFNIQNTISENNQKLAELEKDPETGDYLDKIGSKKLIDENQNLGKSLKQSFAISNNIKENYGNIKEEYYKKVDNTFKNQRETKKLNDEVVELEKEKSSASPERVAEIDSSIQEKKNQAAGIAQIRNQDARYSGINLSAVTEDVVRQPFGNIEETSPSFDYSEKSVTRAKFLDNKYKILQAQYNDAKQNGLIQEQKNLKQQLDELSVSIPNAQQQATAYQDQVNSLSERANDPNLQGEEKSQVDEEYTTAQENLQNVSDDINHMLDSKYQAEDKLFNISQGNPIAKKVFHDYEDLREFAEDFQKQNADNFDNKNIKADVDSIVDNFGAEVLGVNPINVYEDVLERITLSNISEDEIIKELKNSVYAFQKFEELASEMPDPSEYVDSLNDITVIGGNIKTLIEYTSKVRSDVKFNVAPNKLGDLFVQLEHEQLLDLTQDYSVKALNNKDFVDVAGLSVLKDSLIGSIESLKHTDRAKLSSTPAYQREIIPGLNKSLTAVNNLLEQAKDNLAAKEQAQNTKRAKYAADQIGQVLLEGSPISFVLQRYQPDYLSIIDSDPVNGVAVLWEKVRSSNNKEFLKQLKEAISYTREISPVKDGLDSIEKAISTDYSFSTALSQELSVVDSSALAPSSEQVISIRELLMGLTSKDNNINFLQGLPSTGKSSVVLPIALKVAKKIGVYSSDDQVYTVQSSKEFLEMQPEEFEKYSLLVIDNFQMVDNDFYLSKIETIQKHKSQNNESFKVILLGSNITETSDSRVNYITPLNLKFRSDNESINNLAGFFENSKKKVTEVSGIATGNLSTPGIQGTIVTNRLQDLVTQVAADSENTSKLIVVASEIPKEIEDFKRAFSDIGIPVLSAAEAQATSAERVYIIGSARSNGSTNPVINSAINRASHFSMLYLPTLSQFQNFTNAADSVYLDKIQKEKDFQLKANREKYNNQVTDLAELADRFGITSKIPSIESQIHDEEIFDDILEEVEPTEKEVEATVQTPKGGISVTYPETAALKDKVVKDGDAVFIRKVNEGYRVFKFGDNAFLGFIESADLPASIVAKLDSGTSVPMEVSYAKHINFLYKSNTNDVGSNLVLDKIETFLNGVYKEGEERPKAKDILNKSKFSIVSTSLDPAKYEKGSIKLSLIVPGKSKGNLSINFSQILSKDYKGDSVLSDRIKVLQDFTDKVNQLNDVVDSKGKFGTSAFSTLIYTASSNLEIAYDLDGKAIIKNKTVNLSEEEFKNVYASLAKTTFSQTALEAVLKSPQDLQQIMSLSTDIASMYYGVKRAVVNFKKLDAEITEASNLGRLNECISSLNAYDKKKYFLYEGLKRDGFKLKLNKDGSKATFKNADNKDITSEFLEFGEGPVQKAFSAVVLPSKELLEKNGIKYTYSRKNSDTGKISTRALPLISTTQNVLVLEANTLAKNEGLDTEVFTPEDAYAFIKDVLNNKLQNSTNEQQESIQREIDDATAQYEKTLIKDFTSVSLSHLARIMDVYQNEGLRIPTSKSDVTNANSSLDGKMELGKKLSSNFIGVTPGTLTLKIPGIAEKNITVTTPAENALTLETNNDKSNGLTDNISNLLDNSDNFTCD